MKQYNALEKALESRRKPWVFLSISDMADCGASVDDPSRWELLGDGWGNMIVQYTRLVEAKLKEKNT